MAPDAALRWNIVTVFFQIVAASGLSFCLARSSFWHIDRRAGHSDLQVYLQDQSSQASDHVRSAQGRPSFDKNDEDRRKLSIPMFLTKRWKQADAPAQDWAPQPTEQPGSISGIPPERSGQSNPAPTVAETEDFVSWQDIVFESSHSSLRKLAIRSLIASLIGLIASCVNVAVWIAYRGRRESMTCMRWCFVDVTINAFVVAALVQGRGDETWWQNELRQQQTSVRFAPSNEDSSPLGEGTERGRAVVSPKCLASSTLPSTSPRPQVVCLPLAPNPQTFEFTPEHDIDNPGDNKGLVQEPNRHQSTAPCQMRRSLQFPSAARSVDSRRWSSTE
ncbi:hypothetical protein PIIN_04269 [Serendipita indica DSM 11827]|uniref:Transmembrane protein n=1 Tax=Serendipita indica (strain DSM 11827) TaxID=1109443 RepID=G4TG84_SERID|nr:hypothetical protein PIIN_04269 [Serendipita indica DSM 11827]